MRKSKRKVHRQAKIPAIVAQSKKTNIAHGFTNPIEWEKNIALFARGYQDRIAQDLLKAVPFWSWLGQQAAPQLDQSVKWKSTLYRIVYGGYDPLSVAGPLARGGRYNLGAAQHRQERCRDLRLSRHM